VLVDRGGKQEYVTVQPGLSTGGYVEVKHPDERLAPGQLVVVGYKTSRASGSVGGGQMRLMEDIRPEAPIKTASIDADHVLDLRKVCKQFGTDPAVDALIDVDLVFAAWRMAVDNRSIRLGKIDAVEYPRLPRPPDQRTVSF